ncbi:hypothetical protein KC19_11G080800 [Ceratodon purpureus]|uniref:Uncharacterized protein n=1 Tax=Ceratodon purpureus TaxID=3225 RepID=A0A8T0GF91_CERPU|nr:hypothetical protein KC19_11G080800 [Ceratodon purpureus]
MAPLQVALLFLGLVVLPAALATDGTTFSMSENGYNVDWMAGHATWYGDPYGEGSSGGACGYTQLTGTPIGSKIAAGNNPIFQGGKGCGQCYEVKCNYPSCNPEPTRIVITDLCPGGTYCSTGNPAFDFSGAAITAMALPGRDGELKKIGLYDIQYKRVPCEYQNQNIAFKVDFGASAYWLSFTVKYLGGPGDIESVEIRQVGSNGSFQPCQHSWGANWMLINYTGQPFDGPYDVKITAKLNGHSVIAYRAIPKWFQPGALYNSNVQFKY